MLGPLEATVGGEPAPLGGSRQRTLLALLAVAAGSPLSGERIAEEIWGDEPPAGWETTVQTYVARLRAALGADAVVSTSDAHALAPGTTIDAVAFERLLAAAAKDLADGTAGRASERLQEALALWRGPAYVGARDCAAVELAARRLDELRLIAVELRIEADLALGRAEELVTELQAFVAAEPFRERLHRQLVLALFRSGRRADALDAYREARDLLDREPRIEPGEELQWLEGQVRHRQGAS